MNIILIGSIDDTFSRLTHQWFVTNEVQAEYVEAPDVPYELYVQGVTSLPIVLMNGIVYCYGYDLEKLERLTHL